MDRDLRYRALGLRPGLRLVIGALAGPLMGVLLALAPARAQAAPGVEPAAAAASNAPRRWISVPRVTGRITAKELGLVINSADPYSVEVGEFYVRARHLKPAQVLRVQLPVKAVLTREEFDVFSAAVAAHFGTETQALALAWVLPYAVNCNSITGALALGYDVQLCSRSCAPSRRSLYFNSATQRPYQDLGFRPSMLLAAANVAQAKAMIQRGVDADHSLGLRGAPPVNAYFVTTPDRARSVRSISFPPSGLIPRAGVTVHLESTRALENVDRVLLYETGAVRVDKLDTVQWVPGALADHLTSTGGQLVGGGGQMSILEWIGSGATASHGTVSEPCSHPQKFPQPQVLLLNYLQGSSALEAYWKSVAWPQQGVFVGEPLAAPFARR
ncbi:MAG: TIGR03790 family protein [Burkholderiaceae bacterium]